MLPAPCFILASNGPCLNRGCEAILRSTIAILEKEFGESHFLSCPGTSYAAGDVGAVSHPRLQHYPHPPRLSARWIERQWRKVFWGERSGFEFERHLPMATAVLALGGDLFTLDYGKPDSSFALLGFVAASGVPFILWGATVGPFSADPEYEKLAIEKLAKASLICVRESRTKQYLDEQGLSAKVRLAPDPAFVLEPISAELPGDLETCLAEGCLGVNLSPMLADYAADGAEWPGQARECLKELDRAIDVPIILIPHVETPGSNDYAFLTALSQTLGRTKNRIHVLSRRYNAPQLKYIISKLSLFAGARTHATIAALSTGVPTLAIAYSTKAIGIMADLFGDGKWLVRVGTMTPDRFVDKILELWRQRESVRQHLEGIMPGYKKACYQAAAYLRQCILEDHENFAGTEKVLAAGEGREAG